MKGQPVPNVAISLTDVSVFHSYSVLQASFYSVCGSVPILYRSCRRFGRVTAFQGELQVVISKLVRKGLHFPPGGHQSSSDLVTFGNSSISVCIFILSYNM